MTKISNVRFPVIRTLQVDGYPLYPGRGGNGLDINFLPGVSVIVGMNGIGKTTLLNLMLWMLCGPYVPTKAEVTKPGTGQHKRSKVSRFSYFAARVNEPVPDASATIGIAFGKDVLTVKRQLSNLKIVGLQKNKTHFADPDEDKYIDLVKELSGTRDDFDFDFIVRHLLFFLEEKAPLLWSEEGQYELLRILFLDDELSSQSNRLQEQIRKLDSQIRNRNWQLEDLRETVKGYEERQVEKLDGDSIAMMTAALSGLRSRLRTMDTDGQSLRSQLDRLERAQFEGEQRADEARQRVRQLEHGYFRQGFPTLPSTAELTIGRLLAGDSCLVCGCQSSSARQRFKQLLKAEACPVCETPQQAKPVAKANANALRKAEIAAEVADADIRRLTSELDAARIEFSEFKTAQRDVISSATRLEMDLADAEAKALPGDSKFSVLKRQLDDEEAALQDELNKVTLHRKALGRLLVKARDQIADVSDKICADFAHLAGKFLEEECLLEYTMHRRTVGQSGQQLDFPSFILKMSSATSKTPRQRFTDEEVSESQKEFLDLAFRMSVMRTAVARNAPTMLVIETPEASLDSYFIDRAGEMLREFTWVGAEMRNSVIASSNLNRENMIPALLGLRSGSRKRTPKAEIPKRIVNLLELAAKPRALQNKLQYYREQLTKAIGGG